ncbi:MAG: hypothetical protein L0H31_00345 [Nocardioidaceae bacterium]|nr:hypothetical protein [Nocardioidaceae bacterium]
MRQTGETWSCPAHGVLAPLWRVERASYEAFGAHLRRVGNFPTYLPWPLGPGWSVSDFAAVGGGAGVGTRATMTCLTGTSQADGPVEVMVISEEPGTGLGARLAGLRSSDGAGQLDPGAEIGEGAAAVRVRVDQQFVGLRPVSISTELEEWDRSVLVGEAFGRWLWLIMRPSSAVLLLGPEWIVRDISTSGPQLVAVPFGGSSPGW